MKDFRGIELHIGDTVAALVSLGDISTGLTLATIIDFTEQFGKEACVVRYHPSGYAPSSTLKRVLSSPRVAKL